MEVGFSYSEISTIELVEVEYWLEAVDLRRLERLRDMMDATTLPHIKNPDQQYQSIINKINIAHGYNSFITTKAEREETAKRLKASGGFFTG